MAKPICFSTQAVSFLKKLTKKESEKILEKIKQYAAFPEELQNQIKKLKGSKFYRLRVGDYRIIFDDQGKILQIIKIGNRGDVYRGI